MPKFTVIVTGTWSIDVEAENSTQAEAIAYNECLDDFDLELMNLEFEAFNEEEENA